jgi:hypothetical protein
MRAPLVKGEAVYQIYFIVAYIQLKISYLAMAMITNTYQALKRK